MKSIFVPFVYSCQLFIQAPKIMKQHFLFVLLFMIILSGCEMSEENEIYEDLQIVNDGELVLDLSDIDYYDFSTHIVYLTENNRLKGDYDKLQGAKVMVDGEEIYSLNIHELYSSFFPTGVHINRLIDNFGDFAFRISFGTGNNDPRDDYRIISVLKRNKKYRAGPSIETASMTRQGNEIRLRIKLRNLDNQSYYHLDPNKMGKGLFHYFTNGLFFIDYQELEYQYHKIPIEQPENFNYWSMDWMSLIKGKETKTFTFTYPYDNVPTGRDLRFSFNFPSPELSISQRSDLIQEKGRVWLGTVGMEKMVRF
jgi:hypothetical protein